MGEPSKLRDAEIDYFLEHEVYLESEAFRDCNASLKLYFDQGELANQRYANKKLAKRLDEAKAKIKRTVEPVKPADLGAAVFIKIEEQDFWTWNAKDDEGFRGKPIHNGEFPDKVMVPEAGLDRATLMKCSTTARDFFTWNPDQTELPLPVKYPWKHAHSMPYQAYKNNLFVNGNGRKYMFRYDSQMAYIRPDEIETYIIPWLKVIEQLSPLPDNATEKDIPRIEIPDTLLEKIHLYNAMLQLGLPSFIQRPLIEDLCVEIYRTKLSQCELETLEITIGRFHAGTVAVLDPVISAFVGSYGTRQLADRKDAQNSIWDSDEDEDVINEDANIEAHPPETARQDGKFDKRKDLLTYTSKRNPDRAKRWPRDTYIVPPPLPVLGHSIRNWSNVRADGDARAAHVGYPLHIGKLKYYNRKDKRKRPREENIYEAEDPDASDAPKAIGKPVVIGKQSDVFTSSDNKEARGTNESSEIEESPETDVLGPANTEEAQFAEDAFEETWPEDYEVLKFDVQELVIHKEYDVLRPMKKIKSEAGQG